MNIKNELIKAYDEGIKNLYKSMDMEIDEMDEEDKAFMNLKREELFASLSIDVNNCSEKDNKFVLDNLDLYKQLFSASISGDIDNLKLTLTELAKNWKLI